MTTDRPARRHLDAPKTSPAKDNDEKSEFVSVKRASQMTAEELKAAWDAASYFDE